MNFEPQKYFIRLIDLFSILLPGAILTFILMTDVGTYISPEPKILELKGTIAWIVFLLASYLISHFIFLS